MRHLVLVLRILLGLLLGMTGLNGFLNFMEPPPDLPQSALDFLGALDASGYLLPVKSAVEVACAVLLVTGLFVPLALVLFAPILVNIVGYHLTVDTDLARGAMAWVVLFIELFLAFAYREHFACLFACRAKSSFQEG